MCLKLKANYLPPLELMQTFISVSPIYLKGVVLQYEDKFTTTFCSETDNTSPLTHWHTQSSVRRPGSLGPLIHSRLWQFRDQPNITAQQGYVLKSIKINFA